MCETCGDVDVMTLSEIELPGTSRSVPEARRHVRTILGPKSHDVELAVSELVSNAVEHSDSSKGGTVTVKLAAGCGRRMAVTDKGSAVNQPRLVDQSTLSEHGNGLRIVRAISSEWGVMVTAAGTTVWCEWVT